MGDPDVDSFAPAMPSGRESTAHGHSALSQANECSFQKLRNLHGRIQTLYLAYYNFCRVHTTLKTPAVESGLATRDLELAS